MTTQTEFAKDLRTLACIYSDFYANGGASLSVEKYEEQVGLKEGAFLLKWSRALAASAGEAAPYPTGRTPKDYAIEHAGYLATAAEGLIAAVNAMAEADEAVEAHDPDNEQEHQAAESQWNAAREGLSEATRSVREGIHEFRKRRDRAAAAPSAPQVAAPEPIPMVLHCPACGLQHVDQPEHDLRDDYAVVVGAAELSAGYAPWKNPPHRSHLCHGCGHIWRPADVPTTGVPAVLTAGKADSPQVAAAQSAPRDVPLALKRFEDMVRRQACGERSMQSVNESRLELLDAFDAHNAPQVAAAPTIVKHERRQRPTWLPEGEGWTAWEECSEGTAEDCRRVPILHNWQHEVRALCVAAAPEIAAPCIHRWVDARNEYVTSGEVCMTCGAMRAGNTTTDADRAAQAACTGGAE